MEQNNTSQVISRYDWIDTLKFLGIFAIYLGHFGASAGLLYPFVFVYHVPLFFFVAGLFAGKDKSRTIKGFFYKKIKALLIPYAIYSLISMIAFSILNNYGLEDTVNIGLKAVFGIRNTLIAGSLWFIPCMFVVSCLYFILNKISTNKVFIVISVSLLFIVTQTVLPHNPLVQPSWIFNIDSAMYYLIYYMLGDLCVSRLLNFTYKTSTNTKKWGIRIGALGIILLTILIYFRGVPALISRLPFSSPVVDVILALVLIAFNILVALYLKDIKLFRSMGRNTLSLCGLEDVVKVSLNVALMTFNINLNLYNPLSCVLYTFICLFIAHFIAERLINKLLFKKQYSIGD